MRRLPEPVKIIRVPDPVYWAHGGHVTKVVVVFVDNRAISYFEAHDRRGHVNVCGSRAEAFDVCRHAGKADRP
jgi:hypothetical protein